MSFLRAAATFVFGNGFYYSNYTTKTDEPGLFYMLVDRQLENPAVIPSEAGWGYLNWNFTVIASSGDPTVTENVTIHLSDAWPPGTADK